MNTTPTPTPESSEPKNILQLCPAKKASVRPPDPLIKPALPDPANKELMLAPYPDGVLLKCSPKPGLPPDGKFLIHDSLGTIVALCLNKDMANLFCTALHVYFTAAKQNAAEQVAAVEKVATATVLDEADAEKKAEGEMEEKP